MDANEAYLISFCLGNDYTKPLLEDIAKCFRQVVHGLSSPSKKIEKIARDLERSSGEKEGGSREEGEELQRCADFVHAVMGGDEDETKGP